MAKKTESKGKAKADADKKKKGKKNDAASEDENTQAVVAAPRFAKRKTKKAEIDWLIFPIIIIIVLIVLFIIKISMELISFSRNVAKQESQSIQNKQSNAVVVEDNYSGSLKKLQISGVEFLFSA